MSRTIFLNQSPRWIALVAVAVVVLGGSATRAQSEPAPTRLAQSESAQSDRSPSDRWKNQIRDLAAAHKGKVAVAVSHPASDNHSS